MKEKRWKFELMAHILRATHDEPKSKTAISQETKLNYATGSKYIDVLEGAGLLEDTEEGYVVADEGKEFLACFKRLKEHLGEEFELPDSFEGGENFGY